MRVPRQTYGRANALLETVLHTLGPGLRSHHLRGSSPTGASQVRALLLRLHGQLLWVVGFSSLPQPESDGHELACQRYSGQLLPHSTIDPGLVVIPQGSRTSDGRRSSPFEDVLEFPVVIAIEAPGHGSPLPSDDLAIDLDEVRAGVGDDGQPTVGQRLRLVRNRQGVRMLARIWAMRTGPR